MLVMPSENILVYFDSFYQECDNKILNGILTYLQVLLACNMEAEKWTLYNPTDIPKQTDGGNCGAHICSWGFIIANSEELDFNITSTYQFKEEDMNDVRRSIANFLYYSPYKTNTTKTNKRSKSDKVKIEELSKFLTKSRLPPWGFDSTYDFCINLKSLLPINFNFRTRK